MIALNAPRADIRTLMGGRTDNAKLVRSQDFDDDVAMTASEYETKERRGDLLTRGSLFSQLEADRAPQGCSGQYVTLYLTVEQSDPMTF